MMRVVVEIHPHGVSQAKRSIATIDIANVSDLAEVSDYEVRAATDGVPLCTERSDSSRLGTLLVQGRPMVRWISRTSTTPGATRRRADERNAE